jgi:DNA-binding MarR family transcriptional regulator/GNAT superfamily N-acetyltransferase
MDAVGDPRSFERTIARLAGAFAEASPSSGRLSGQARLLMAIEPEGSDLRLLRARLGLDSGYLSRLMRRLGAAGLVRVERSDRDGRVRTAHLSALGRTERDKLDRRSEQAARAVLKPLTQSQQARMLGAMAEVETLLVASTVEITDGDPGDSLTRLAIATYLEELSSRMPTGYDPARARPLHDRDLVPPAGVFLVAGLSGEVVGCGGLRLHGKVAEIKRMWVAPRARGLGIGRRLLAELESRALAAGANVAQLDTSASLSEAVALYRGSGYCEVAPFNDEPYADYWFEKALARSDPDGRVGSVQQSAASARRTPPSLARPEVPGGTEAGGQSVG